MTTATTARKGIRVILAAAMVHIVVAAWYAPNAFGSQADAESGPAEQSVTLSQDKLTRPTYTGKTDIPEPVDSASPGSSGLSRTAMKSSVSYASAGMWVWNRGRVALQLVERHDIQGGFRTLVMTDLDTDREVGRLRLPRHVYGWAAISSVTRQEAPQYVGAMDDQGGRLFLAYRHPKLTTDLGWGELVGTSPEALSHGTGVCLGGTTTKAPPCVAGVLVIDLASLAVVGDIPLESLRVDGGLPSRLLMTSYAPPRGPGDVGKVLLFVQDAVTPAPAIAFGSSNVKKAPGLFVNYVVQLDPQELRQDWAVRVDACRGNRQPTDDNLYLAYDFQPYAAAVLRSASLTDPAVVAACHYGSAMGAAIVKIPLNAAGNPATLPVEVDDPTGGLSDSPQDSATSRQAPAAPVRVAQQQLAAFGPEKTFQMIADQAGQRMLLEVSDGNPAAKVWWVFDTAGWRFLGTIGIGPFTGPNSTTGAVESVKGFDPVHGRLYHLMPPYGSFAGGLFVVDVRRVPLSQALVFPEFAERAVPGEQFVLATFSGDGDEPTRVFVPSTVSVTAVDTFYRVLVDSLPTFDAAEVVADPFAGRTLDLDEVEGVTASAFDGAARGYGARVLLVGGVESVPRAGPLDPVGQAYQCFETEGQLCAPLNTQGVMSLFLSTAGSPVNACVRADRDVTLGFVGPSQANIVDASGARGGATPVAVDSGTRADVEAPASRCTGSDWDQAWQTALFGRAPVGEPKVPWVFEEGMAECVAAEEPTAGTGDAVASRFAAKVDCSQEEASGYAYARGMGESGVNVGEALSSYRIYRDPGRGIVSRVESVARGVTIPGVLRIDSVRGVAESWANGRRYSPPTPQDGAAAYDPNCDFERTAGTCFTRHIFGLWTPGYSCGPCGDEKGGLERFSRAFGQYGSIRLRDPDPVLARGADNGFIAAVTKADAERFGDLVLNNDLLQTVLPTLEIIRQAPPGRSLATGGPRGRQIIQLAGVEVGTSYGIVCLLVYDETANTCAAPKESPGSITVSLADPDGKPLAGGVFEVRADADTDGVVGLQDALLADGACVTADDGVGTCMLEGLAPGAYLVSQTAAPAGYSRVAEPFKVDLASGEARTVAFTNTSNTSVIDLTVADDAGTPVAGAGFAAYPDPDADGKIAPDTTPTAACATGADGTCRMIVPAGSYVLVQTAAPAGLDPIEPVAFTFATGGQTAAVAITNYPLAAPTPAPGPVIDYTTPFAPAPPVEHVDGYTPPAATPPGGGDTIDLPEVLGGTVVRVVRAPGDALRLLARDPRQAAAFTAALALFTLAAIAVRRRQHALHLIDNWPDK